MLVGPLELDAPATVRGEHVGGRNVIVEASDRGATDGSAVDLLFDEIGEFEGETWLDADGEVWLDVFPEAGWRLKVE